SNEGQRLSEPLGGRQTRTRRPQGRRCFPVAAPCPPLAPKARGGQRLPGHRTPAPRRPEGWLRMVLRGGRRLRRARLSCRDPIAEHSTRLAHTVQCILRIRRKTALSALRQAASREGGLI